MTNIPESFKRKAEEITQDLLDAKSNVRFKDKLFTFVEWLLKESVMLAYLISYMPFYSFSYQL